MDDILSRKCFVILPVLLLTLSGCGDGDRADEFNRLQGQPIPLAVDTASESTIEEPLRALPELSSDALNTPVVQLGRDLFHDTRLSGDGTLTCASCHAIHDGGDDNLPTAVGIRGQIGPINTPTVLNSGFNFRQFWDGRAPSLDEQARGPVAASIEMGADWDDVVASLSDDDQLTSRFKDVFGSDVITQDRVVHAIARFEETLVTPAPFDRFLNGESTAISSSARVGYEKFKVYGCSSCHQGINVGGNLYQEFGVMQSVDIDSFTAENATPIIGERHDNLSLVKVPSLRNIELTAPYFHAGKINDLSTAVKIMGLSQIGKEIPDADIALIVAFLKSLTGDWQQHAALIRD